MEKLIKIVEWSKLKIRIQKAEDIKFYFYEREIWWASLGSNIGFEEDGKNSGFERPVLVLKKFSSRILWVLPLTSREREGDFYYTFKFDDIKSTVILPQLRTISSKRLIRKMGKISEEEFVNIKMRIKNFL